MCSTRVIRLSYFNPRSPWGERQEQCRRFTEILQFQSTLPVGGATWITLAEWRYDGISIHAPRGGSDVSVLVWLFWVSNFNPRSPWGERRHWSRSGWRRQAISIHAPRGGSDNQFANVKTGLMDFNPRSPWGERRHLPSRTPRQKRFQSTLPVGGATFLALGLIGNGIFQSTLPVGGATLARVQQIRWYRFQSTLPVGGATKLAGRTLSNDGISIHAPRGGSD